MVHIGVRIKARREELGMSQDDLAIKMGYKNRSTIAKIESCVNDVSQPNIVKFADVLNTSIAYLMSWDEEEISSIEKHREESFADYMTEAEADCFQVIKSLKMSDDELKKVSEYAKFLISQRG